MHKKSELIFEEFSQKHEYSCKMPNKFEVVSSYILHIWKAYLKTGIKKPIQN